VHCNGVISSWWSRSNASSTCSSSSRTGLTSDVVIATKQYVILRLTARQLTTNSSSRRSPDRRTLNNTSSLRPSVRPSRWRALSLSTRRSLARWMGQHLGLALALARRFQLYHAPLPFSVPPDSSCCCCRQITEIVSRLEDGLGVLQCRQARISSEHVRISSWPARLLYSAVN